jgi:hypothetical protein
LEIIRDKVFDIIGMEDPKRRPRNRPENTKQVENWRAHLRIYFDGKNGTLRSMSEDVIICEDMVNFTSRAMKLWWDIVEESDKPKQKIFVTINERNKAQLDKNKKKDVLLQELAQIQERLPPPERKDWDPKKNATKSQIISILQQLQDVITQRMEETAL